MRTLTNSLKHMNGIGIFRNIRKVHYVLNNAIQFLEKFQRPLCSIDL